MTLELRLGPARQLTLLLALMMVHHWDVARAPRGRNRRAERVSFMVRAFGRAKKISVWRDRERISCCRTGEAD
jgi:hypothetical protein